MKKQIKKITSLASLLLATSSFGQFVITPAAPNTNNLTTNGNVGIGTGTSLQAARLQVLGTANQFRLGNATLFADINQNASGLIFTPSSSANRVAFGIASPASGVGFHSNLGLFRISDPASTTRAFQVSPNVGVNGDIPAGVSLMTALTVSGEGLTIIPSGGGNNGVKLGACAFNGISWKSMWETQNTIGGVNPNLLLVKNGGNVGIGTSNPSYALQVASSDALMTSNPIPSSNIYLAPTHWGGYFSYAGVSKLGINAALHGYNLNNTSTTSNISEGVGVYGKAERTANASGNTYCTGVKGFASGSAFNIGGVFVGASPDFIGGKPSSGENNVESSTSFGIWASADGNNGIAGFFNGKAYSTSYYQPADTRLKNETKPITESIEKINALKPIGFTFNIGEYQNMNLPMGQQFGLNPEDLENVMPELVIEMKDLSNKNKTDGKIENYKAVNYTNLIPLLISGIQDQQKQIEDQKKEITTLKNLEALQQQQINDLLSKISGQTGIGSVNSQIDGFSLEQNIPNPFSQETVIKYTLTQQTKTAVLNVYDLSGKQVTSFPLTELGASSITISSEKLAAGIYIYSVVADGKIMDSKRMIVTQK